MSWYFSWYWKKWLIPRNKRKNKFLLRNNKNVKKIGSRNIFCLEQHKKLERLTMAIIFFSFQFIQVWSRTRNNKFAITISEIPWKFIFTEGYARSCFAIPQEKVLRPRAVGKSEFLGGQVVVQCLSKEKVLLLFLAFYLGWRVDCPHPLIPTAL